MKTIAHNDFYQVGVDPSTNTLYWTAKGKWVRHRDVEHCLEDLKKAGEYLKPGCRVLSNVTGLEVMLLPETVTAVQKVIADMNPSKLASVWNHQVLAAMQVDRQATKVGEDYSNLRQNFSDLEQAEEWLFGK